jgi:hypothetical protein
MMRDRQNEARMLLKKMEVHEELIELSRSEPLFSLKQTVILSSNEICEDCQIFKKRVNERFQLNIEINLV